jgi:alkaline phosphatase D
MNNYMGAGNDSNPPFASANDAFRLYNAESNYEPAEPDQHYYHFRYADVAFFVMDTRRYRSDVTKEEPMSRTMLGDKQLTALYKWLEQVSLFSSYRSWRY